MAAGVVGAVTAGGRGPGHFGDRPRGGGRVRDCRATRSTTTNCPTTTMGGRRGRVETEADEEMKADKEVEVDADEEQNVEVDEEVDAEEEEEADTDGEVEAEEVGRQGR